MRIRTLLALATGAALGAGWTYLSDPDHGPDRRREALTTALERGRDVDWSGVADRVTAVAAEVGRSAAEGYRDAVLEPSPPQ